MRRWQYSELSRPFVPPRPCSYSDTLQTYVHRFALGRRTCYCGDVTVDEPPVALKRWGSRVHEAVKA